MQEWRFGVSIVPENKLERIVKSTCTLLQLNQSTKIIVEKKGLENNRVADAQFLIHAQQIAFTLNALQP